MKWFTSMGHSSSNTWVGAGRPYVETSTSVQTDNIVVCTVDSCKKTHQTHHFFKGSWLWWGIFRRYVSLSAQFERLVNLYLRHRVHGHCYPRHAGYSWTIYRRCNRGEFNHDEQCTHFYYNNQSSGFLGQDGILGWSSSIQSRRRSID